MGRADLASHRSSSPSDTKPVSFPKRAAWVLDKLVQIPNTSVASTLASIRDSTTQKTQVAALKLLGIQLRDAHTQNNSSGQSICACIAGKDSQSNELFICRIADSVITGVLFDSPGATAGLVSTALRAVLKSPVHLDEAHTAFSDLFGRLEASSSSTSSYSNISFSEFVTEMCLISVTVADPKSRCWVFDHEKRIGGALRRIQAVVQIYVQTTLTDEMQTMNMFSNTDHSVSFTHRQAQVQSVKDNRRLLENACDFALKGAQDLLNGLRKSSFLTEDLSGGLSIQILATVKNFVSSCKELLLLSTIPRNCALACSIAYVTSLLIIENADSEAEKASQLLKRQLFAELSQFPHFPRLSLLRAIMEAPAAKVAHNSLLFPPDDHIWATKDNFTVFERLIQMVNDNGDAHLRFLAMDALVKCIRRRRPLKLGSRCRSAVVEVIKGRWNETFPGTTLQMKEAIAALIAVDGNDPESTTFWEDMAFALVKGNWNYRGIYAPLSVLIPRVGALRLLESAPKCQEKAIEAACGDSRLTKAAADWLGSFWNALREECQKSSDFTSLTFSSLLLPLTDSSRPAFRQITAEQILPVYFQRLDKKHVEFYAKSLLKRLGQLAVENDRKVGAVVTIMSVARRHGVFIGSFSDSQVLHLLRDAIRSADDEMKSTAFELIVTSRAPTEPIDQVELDLVLMYLPIALKHCSSLSHHARFRHSMRRFFERFAACRKAASDGCGGWWTRERKRNYGGIRTASFEHMRETLIEQLTRFETECFKILLASVYPGAAFGRRINAFELLVLMSENLGLQRFISSGSYGAVLAGISVGVLDEWERPRRSALRVLLSLPDSVPGLQTLPEAGEMQSASIPMLESPRLRDVDSGALIIRFIHKKLLMPMVSSKTAVADVTERKYFSFPHGLLLKSQEEHDVPCLQYAKSILASLEEILDPLHFNFSEACESGLFHGRFRILREVMKDYAWKDMVTADNRHTIASFVCKVVDLGCNCAHIALKGVSFDALTNFPEFVSEDEGLDDNEDFTNDKKQLEITTSFLSLKEICVTLGILVHEVPLEDMSLTTGEEGILSLKDVKRIGDLFLNVFTNTRHWGAIDGAAEGFQLLCERLLQMSSFTLRSLPKVWSLKMVNEGLKGNMYVLRRSAGLPVLVNAVVSSEANSESRSLHAPLLDGIATLVLKHLEHSHKFVDADMLASTRSKEEEGVSHALNILRSLFLNAKVGKRILKYFEKAMRCTVEAFCSASWLIRNSALMLLTALIRRGIGVGVKDDATLPPSSFSTTAETSSTTPRTRRFQGVTPVQFFSRYPDLHSFLKTQLELSVPQTEKDENMDYSSLFPSLHLLSSLSPGAPEDPATMVSMKPFREVLRRCAHSRSDFIRQEAASASVLLIEDQYSATEFLVELIVSGISKDPLCDGVLIEGDNDQEEGDIMSERNETNGYLIRQNHLHGDLATITEVLKWTSQAPCPEHVKDVVRIFAKHIPERMWVATSRNPCMYTRAALIRVLSVVYRMACDLREDPKALELCSSCNCIISLCNDLNDQLRIELLDLEPEQMFIGLPTLQEAFSELSRVRFLHVSQNAEEYPHMSSLQMALSEIEANDPEMKTIALNNLRFVLSKYDVGAFKKGIETISKEAAELLDRIWTHSRCIFKTTEDEELLLSALRLQETLFDFRMQLECSDCLLNQVWTEEELTRIVEYSRYHACMDVREQAIVLLGKAVALYPSWIRLKSAWMDGLELASTSVFSSSRLAICMSLSASCTELSQTHEGLPGDYIARIYLLWTNLLQDDDADVVNHALKAVQTHLWARQDATKNVLPTLTEMFDRLARLYWQSSALFHFAQLMLGSTSETQGSNLLFRFLGTLTGQKVESRTSENRDPGGLKAENTQNTRLFELEEDSSTGEKVLGMQLIARCYSTILLRGKSMQGMQEKAESLIEELSCDLLANLQYASQSIRPGLFGSQSFSTIGFETCYAAILRAYLGIQCVQLFSKQSDSMALREMIMRLRSDTLQWNRSLHPILAMAVNGVCALVDGTRGAWQSEATSQILFLL